MLSLQRFLWRGCARNRSADDAPSAPALTKDWSATLDENCRRCTNGTEYIRKTLPVPLPRRAIVYGFTGEFASRVEIWVVDLDTDEIVKSETLVDDAGNWKRTVSHLDPPEPGILERLRTSAATLWRSEPYRMPFSPNASENDEVVSGSRLVSFSRFSRNDHDIVAAIESALPAGAGGATGSFVLQGPNR
ncbi:MAG: hypothetical protein JOZ72_13265 [Alphaproteobacteria bacterium]|nr:hypothetical protein [Alphaproteobacteria bacterium]